MDVLTIQDWIFLILLCQRQVHGSINDGSSRPAFNCCRVLRSYHFSYPFPLSPEFSSLLTHTAVRATSRSSRLQSLISRRLSIWIQSRFILLTSRSRSLSSMCYRTRKLPRCRRSSQDHFRHPELPLCYQRPDSCSTSWICQYQCRCHY